MFRSCGGQLWSFDILSPSWTTVTLDPKVTSMGNFNVVTVGGGEIYLLGTSEWDGANSIVKYEVK